MAVEDNMAELKTTWWDLLQKIACQLDMSYAALWSLTADGRNLVWKQGYFHMRRNNDADAELFHSLYSSCTFSPGVGYAGHALAHMTNSMLWLSGDDLHSLDQPVANQSRFLRAAGIQTVVCFPFGLPSSSYVLELGTVKMVRETEELARDTKQTMLYLLADALPHLLNDSISTGIAHRPDPELFRGSMRPLHETAHDPSSVAPANETILESARKYASTFPPSIFERGILPTARQLGPNVYPEMFQPVDHDDVLGRNRGILNAVLPQLSVDVPEFPASAEPSPAERFTSQWGAETSLAQMELNAFQSWTSMAEATSTLDLALRGLPGTASATSSRLAAQIEDPNDEIGHMLPFSSSLEQFMAADDQQHRSLLRAAAGASLRGSSSRSSMSFKSQNAEENEISSTVFENYGDCHISEFENIPRSGGNTIYGEAESNWRSEAPRDSGPSSKETSPDSNLPPTRHSYGIHPRISSTTPTSRQQQQQFLDIHRHGGLSKQQSFRLLERQHSSVREQSTQHEDQKPGPSEVGDSTPRLVQFGNVLQLGNAAGQVTEALPQEHDEAAVSHMLAERRRRNKQNENFIQLKSLIPSAAKMDKASVLAATISYIHELKERVKHLEESNQSLKNQLLGAEQDQPSPVAQLLTTKAKGSPRGIRIRSAKSLSPTDEDKIKVSPDGDGNLVIEIRKPCNQPDTLTQIFASLKELHFKVMNFNANVNDNQIHASIIVKMKRKNSAGQSAVCAEVEQALTECLNNLGSGLG